MKPKIHKKLIKINKKNPKKSEKFGEKIRKKPIPQHPENA